MGRKQRGATPRNRHVGFRLDDQDSAMLDRQLERRNATVTDYFVGLMKEDARAEQE